MSKVIISSILTVTILCVSQAFAETICIAQIPKDCQIANTVYSANSTDETQTLQIDCLRSNGEYETFITNIGFKPIRIWSNRIIVPAKVIYRKTNRDNIKLNCHENNQSSSKN